MFGYVECVLLVGTAQEPRRRCVILTATTHNHHHRHHRRLGRRPPPPHHHHHHYHHHQTSWEAGLPLASVRSHFDPSVTPPQLDIYLKHSVRL